MKPLDFVLTPKGAIALVSETNNDGTEASITFIGMPDTHERNAWWDADELVVIDSLPRLLADSTAHPFGQGHADAAKVFGEPSPYQVNRPAPAVDVADVLTRLRLPVSRAWCHVPHGSTLPQWVVRDSAPTEAAELLGQMEREQSGASEVLADAAAQDAELKLLRGLLKECRSHVARVAADDGDLHATELLEQLEKLGISAGESNV